MNYVLSVIDSLWNIKFLTGYRTHIAKLCLFGINAYQAVATSSMLIENGFDLPDMNAALVVTLTGYFALKVDQFAREHQVVP